MLAAALAIACAAPHRPPGGDDDLALLRARNALFEGRSDRARLELEAHLARHPDDLEARRDAGLAWLSGYQPSYFRGTEQLETYLERRPDDAATALRLAETLLALGENDRLARALARAGSSAEAERLRAEAALDFDPARAVEHAQRAAELEPRSPRALVTLARALERGQLQARARAAYEAALAIQPLHAPATYSAARLAEAEGDRELAERLFARHPLVSELLGEGTLAAPSGERALTLIAALRARGVPATLDLALREARAKVAVDRPAEAIAVVESALAAAAATATFELQLEAATILGEAGNGRAARELFARLLAERPRDHAVRSSLLRLALDDGRLDDATALLAAGLAEEPELARYRYFEGELASRRGDEEKAIRALTRALELAPFADAWRLALAERLLASGDRRAFRRTLAEAPESTPLLERYRRDHAAELGDAAGR